MQRRQYMKSGIAVWPKDRKLPIVIKTVNELALK